MYRKKLNALLSKYVFQGDICGFQSFAMGTDTEPGPVYQFAKRPPELTFCQFVYNSETGEILGRTPVSWCKLVAKLMSYRDIVFKIPLRRIRYPEKWTIKDAIMI